MQVGFFFWPYDVALVRGMAEAADAYGYDMIGIADTPGNAMDPWVAATLVAEHTRTPRIALCVTNVVTRHPAVTAPGKMPIQIGIDDQHVGFVDRDEPTQGRLSVDVD